MQTANTLSVVIPSRPSESSLSSAPSSPRSPSLKPEAAEGKLHRKSVSFAPEVEAWEALHHLQDGRPNEALAALNRGGGEAVSHAFNHEKMTSEHALRLVCAAARDKNESLGVIGDGVRALAARKRAALFDTAARQGDAFTVESLFDAGLLGAIPPAGEVAAEQKNFLLAALRAQNRPAGYSLLSRLPEVARGDLARVALRQLLAEGHSYVDGLIADAFTGADTQTAQSLLAQGSPAFARSVSGWAKFARRPDIARLADAHCAPAQSPSTADAAALKPITLVGVDRIEDMLERALKERDSSGTLARAVDHLLAHQQGVKRSDTARHAVLVAAIRGDIVQLKKLAAGGVSLDLKDARGETSLLRMVRANNPAAVQSLLEAGCDVETRDTLQRTALHLAAAHGKEDLIDLLLAAGARKDAVCHPNLGSLTPFQVARNPGCAAKLKTP